MAERGEFGPPSSKSSSEGGGERRNRVSFYMGDFSVNPNLQEQSLSFGYRGRFGYGRGKLNDETGFSYNFNPAMNTRFSMYGQNFDTPSFSYNVPTMDPRVGVSLNLQGNQGKFDPSISANYSTFGDTTVSGSYSPQGYNMQGYSNNLFGIPGLNFQGNYGDSGYRGMISYGSEK